MANIYCTVFNGVNDEPFYLLPTNFGNAQDQYILGVRANMVIVIVDRDNHSVYDMPAPEELRKYADAVKEFKKDPFWKMKLRRYFGKPSMLSEDDL